MYEQHDGYRLGKAERVKYLTRNLTNSYFHLERQAFSVANFDWIMIDPKMSAKAFERISERYGVILITPEVVQNTCAAKEKTKSCCGVLSMKTKCTRRFRTTFSCN